MQFKRKAFFDGFKTQFGHLTQGQVDGLNTLLGFIEADPHLSDVPLIAYMLATVKLECANTWEPIDEYGKGAGRPYGVAVTVQCADGTHSNKYYGRGYVQLTWKSNYKKLGQALGLGDQLVCHPERVEQPATAYQILSYGMRNGSFTGKKLGDYIHGTTKDYVNARRIINGLDKAQAIAHNAERFETILNASKV